MVNIMSLFDASLNTSEIAFLGFVNDITHSKFSRNQKNKNIEI